ECCRVAGVPGGHNREPEKDPREIKVKAKTAGPCLPPEQQCNTATPPLDDFPDLPDCLRRSPPALCDNCGRPATSGQRWDWPGRPDGITLHSSCEAPWFDTEASKVTPSMSTSFVND